MRDVIQPIGNEDEKDLNLQIVSAEERSRSKGFAGKLGTLHSSRIDEIGCVEIRCRVDLSTWHAYLIAVGFDEDHLKDGIDFDPIVSSVFVYQGPILSGKAFTGRRLSTQVETVQAARRMFGIPMALLTGQKIAPEADASESPQTESNQDFLARAMKRGGEGDRTSAVGDELPVLEAADLLGGSATLGVTVRTPADMARLVQSGLPAGVIEKLRSAGFKQTELTVLVAPSRTLNRRKTDGRFTVEESSKIEHLARILALSDRTFGDRRLALDWLRRPQARLSGQSPMDYLASDIGGRVVEEILIQSEYGIFG